jgi:hypothetical protein
MRLISIYLILLAFISASCETPVNQSIDLPPQVAALHLSGKHTSSPSDAIAILKQTPPLRDPVLSGELSRLFHWLSKEAEHGTWILGESKNPREMFCHELSQCVSDRVLSWRNTDALSLSADLSIYQMMITSNIGMLHARAGDQNREYHDHLVTLFKSSNGAISVFDPILMPDAGLHPLSDLLNRLERPESLQFSIVRR